MGNLPVGSVGADNTPDFEKVISCCGFLCEVEGKADTYQYGKAFRAYLCRMISIDEKQEKELYQSEAGGHGNTLKVHTFGVFRVTVLRDGKDLAWRTKKGVSFLPIFWI